MRIGFYNPYFDALGGGERYTLTLASHWAKEHVVNLFWDNPAIGDQAESRFGLDLSGVNVVPNVFATHKFFSKLVVSKQYDLIFFLSDGSIPTSFAKRNILLFQLPFPKIDINPLKLCRYQAVVCYSEFVKENLDARLRAKTIVIYPPVSPIPEARNLKKKNLILSVGRFTEYHQFKKQAVMIEAFKKIEGKLTGWELVLAGGLMPSDNNYLRNLQVISKGRRIKIVTNPNYEALVKYYQEAKIYWHAAGFGEKDPRLMEHFGISTVEAMTAGCVPLVFGGGGQKEIVSQGIDGFLWSTKDQLSQKTIKLVSDTKAMETLSLEAKKSAQRFDNEVFQRDFDTLLKRMHL